MGLMGARSTSRLSFQSFSRTEADCRAPMNALLARS